VIKRFLKLQTYVLRFYVFLKIQTSDFLRFFELLHTFSRTLVLGHRTR